jgi:hypothetical protein
MPRIKTVLRIGGFFSFFMKVYVFNLRSLDLRLALGRPLLHSLLCISAQTSDCYWSEQSFIGYL